MITSRFPRRGFFTGAARALDLGGTFPSSAYDFLGPDADEKAIAADWAAVGLDMENAIWEEFDLHGFVPSDESEIAPLSSPMQDRHAR